MLSIAANASAQLDVENRVVGGSRPYTGRIAGGQWFQNSKLAGIGPSESTGARSEFIAIADLFKELNPEKSRDTSAYLMQQEDIHVAAMGLQGELRAKNLDALFVMEKLYLRLNRRRMGVSETRIFGFTLQAANQLARANDRNALPYLETMLLDQEPNVGLVAARQSVRNLLPMRT
ncbi:MAG TPA: hypothetical protein VH325_00790 [Bryobacteraceae bacterium]|jgi:hypothetical protein|nr:hypothetical protein [Bryobacteraceae bacterium]